MKINQINSSGVSNLKTKFSNIFKMFPLFLRLITCITIIIYILNLFVTSISFYFSNIPYYTILKFQLWRIISTIFITTNIFNIILFLLFWVKYASELESSIGTIKYILLFIMNSILIQIIYCFISCLIAFLINDKTYLLEKINNKNSVSNGGLWPYIICELTLLSLSNPSHPMKFLILSYQFKAKYYPIFLFIIFSIMNSFIIDLEVLTGILYAFLYHFLIKKKIKIQDTFIIKVENLKIFKCLTKMNGFVSVNALENKLVSNTNNVNNIIKDISITQSNDFNSFNGQGVMTGGTQNDVFGRVAQINSSSNIRQSQNE